MMNKNGVTVSVLVVVVIVLAILTTAVVISVSDSIINARLTVWTQEISYVQDAVNENKDRINEILLGEVELDASIVSSEILDSQFKDEQISDNKITLYEINLTKLSLNNMLYGTHAEENDIYVYSNTTGRVYYLKGFELDSKTTYYTLTEDLNNKYDNQDEIDSSLSTVVFKASSITYTNAPITVTVKMPSTYSAIKVTTSNKNIVVGNQVVEGESFVYEVNTTSVKGNYEIYVSYKDGTSTKSTKYAVMVYDETGPMISGIAYENIVYASQGGYIKGISVTDLSGIKTVKYVPNTIAEEDAQTFFEENGSQVVSGRMNLVKGVKEYTIYAEDKAGNFKVLSFDVSTIMPSDWMASVSYIEDGVPIPKGFVASPYKGEDEKESGLVIYALTETEITDSLTDIATKDANKQTSLENRNQFVWVPVDSNDFETLFKRYDYINTTSQISYTLGTNYWELVLDDNNMPADSTKNTTNYVSEETLKEATAMYASVKKYGGFYIARYEVGADAVVNNITRGYIGKGNLSITMGKYPYTAVEWGSSMSSEELDNGAVTISRSFYPKGSDAYGAISTLTYGVQWDRTLSWWKELDPKFNLTSSRSYGVYTNITIAAADMNSNAKKSSYITIDYPGKFGEWKEVAEINSGGAILLTTGAYKKASVYNIYDMAGNLLEWTMEGQSDIYRILRGGYFGNDYSVSSRQGTYPGLAADNYYGFRPSLYIK